MVGSVNKVVIVGNVGKEPEIRHTNNGKKIANFSVATSDSWKDSNGERQERTEWHRIVVFTPSTADFVERYVKKGSKVYIEGSLQTRKWTDNSGQDRYVTEIIIGNFRGDIVLLDGRSDDAMGSMDSSDAGWDTGALGSSSEPAVSDSVDDEIPF